MSHKFYHLACLSVIGGALIGKLPSLVSWQARRSHIVKECGACLTYRQVVPAAVNEIHSYSFFFLVHREKVCTSKFNCFCFCWPYVGGCVIGKHNVEWHLTCLSTSLTVFIDNHIGSVYTLTYFLQNLYVKNSTHSFNLLFDLHSMMPCIKYWNLRVLYYSRLYSDIWKSLNDLFSWTKLTARFPSTIMATAVVREQYP